MMTTRGVPRFRTFLSSSAFLALLAIPTSPLAAASLDSFENASGWSTFADGTATASTSTTAGEDGNALLLTYDLTGGGFVGTTRDMTGRNLLADGANTVRFRYRASGPVNTLEFKFVDNDSTDTLKSDTLIYKQALQVDNVWREVEIPFVGFEIFKIGDKGFELDQAQRYAFVVTRENGTNGSGSLFVDDLVLIRQASYSIPIDSFETGNTNLRGAVSSFGGTGSAVFVTTQSISGTGLELNYAVPGAGFAVFEELLDGMAFSTGTETIEFWVKGAAGGEPLRIQVADSTTQVSVPISNYGTITTTSFQKFNVPIGDFAGIHTGGVSSVKFLFADNAGTGRVYIDDLRIAGQTTGGETVHEVEGFDLDAPLAPYITAATENDATVKFAVVQEADGERIGQMDYTFSGSAGTPFAVIEKKLRPNLLAEPVLSFSFKGTNAANDLEVKVADADGTEYVRKFSAVTNTAGAWRALSLPLEDFAFSKTGADNNLDLKEIKSVTFAIVRKEFKAGTIAFDDLASGVKVAFAKADVGSVLTLVTTPNNPFSPNGDGIKDTAPFTFTLSQTARVELKIYDLRGSPLKTFDMGDLTAGAHSIEWDGMADDGRRVANGVYMFRLEADGANGPTDVFKEIIGVLR